jgi:hypothetical protein
MYIHCYKQRSYRSICICVSLNQEPEIGLEVGGTYAILPRQSSEELTQLPSLLTNKVLELREGLNYLCTASGMC